jgi:hypothetical protein
MFGLFKKKSPLDKLYAKHKKLLERSYQLSHTNRAEADKLQAEAEEVRKEIDELKSKEL